MVDKEGNDTQLACERAFVDDKHQENTWLMRLADLTYWLDVRTNGSTAVATRSWLSKRIMINKMRAILSTF